MAWWDARRQRRGTRDKDRERAEDGALTLIRWEEKKNEAGGRRMDIGKDRGRERDVEDEKEGGGGGEWERAETRSKNQH